MLVRWMTAAVMLTRALAPAAHAEATKALQQAVFSAIERTVIERYYQHRQEGGSGEHARAEQRDGKKGKGKGKSKHKGKSKNNGAMPPGLAKRQQLPPGLAKREVLPPGLAKRELPEALHGELPPLDERLERVIVDHSVVLVERATGRVLDILENVLLGR